jgi:hypothetical protein
MGTHHSEETKQKLRSFTGALTSNWKGGRPKCTGCGRLISYGATTCNPCKVGTIPPAIRKEGSFLHIKRGWFNINGKRMFFRSTWEANYALYLDFLVKQNEITSWEYEVDVFIFHKIQSGTRSYRPDFKVKIGDRFEYHEVKGWMLPKNRTQFRRMRIYYPDVKLIVVDRVAYADLKKKLGKMLSFF